MDDILVSIVYLVSEDFSDIVQFPNPSGKIVGSGEMVDGSTNVLPFCSEISK